MPREDRVVAAREVLLAAEERDQPLVAHVGRGERHAPERDALSVHRGVQHLVVLVEGERGGGRKLVEAHRLEPRGPREPRPAARRVVQVQQHVMPQVGRLRQRPLLALRLAHVFRAAHRHEVLAHEEDRARRRPRCRAIADGDVDAFALQVHHFVRRLDAHVHVRVHAAKAREPGHEP